MLKKMKTLLWLDDMRNPFNGNWVSKYAPEFAFGEGKIFWVKSYSEFVDWINKNGMPYMIAFDHDLGEDENNELISGYDCAKWLVDKCIDEGFKLPYWTVQSSNPVGKDNINGLLNNYLKYSRN